jgi:hypothetical protein
MEEIFPKTSAFSTDTTILAMINALIGIVVPKLADVAVIPGCSFTTTNAKLASTLCTPANHAKHVFSCFPI